MLPTIFIAIPSLYDTELIPTVLGAFESAAHPERIVIGVSIFDDSTKLLKVFKEKTKKYESQIKINFTKLTHNNMLEVLRVGYGRKMAASFYSGEDFMLQCDSHTYLEQDWDEKLIALFTRAKNELSLDKLVLTAYAGRYAVADDGSRAPIPGHESSRYPFYIKKKWISKFIPSWIDEPVDGQGFLPATKFNANFAFGDKQFAEDTGVFEEAYFFEEEPIQSINLHEAGFSLVFPILKSSIVFHLYLLNDKLESNGFRRNSSSYLSPLQLEIAGKESQTTWRSYVLDPNNFAKVKRYEEYCKASMRFGVIKERIIPSTY